MFFMLILVLAAIFFFSSRRRHTRCSRDWSSDVCSSDLPDVTAGNKGSGSGPSSGSAITTANGDLLFSCVTEDAIGKGDTFTAGGGFTKRGGLGIAAAYADEDGIQTTARAGAATLTLSPS